MDMGSSGDTELLGDDQPMMSICLKISQNGLLYTSKILQNSSMTDQENHDEASKFGDTIFVQIHVVGGFRADSQLAVWDSKKQCNR